MLGPKNRQYEDPFLIRRVDKTTDYNIYKYEHSMHSVTLVAFYFFYVKNLFLAKIGICIWFCSFFSFVKSFQLKFFDIAICA